MAAACLLSGFGQETHEAEQAEIRAYAGALLLAEFLSRVPKELEETRKAMAELPAAIARMFR